MIDCEFLRFLQNKTVVKELCVVSAAESEKFRFKNLYKIADHGLSEHCLNWADGNTEYKELL